MNIPTVINNANLVVVKIGTNVLVSDDGVNLQSMQSIAEDISWLIQDNKRVVIVSSGAVGLGASMLHIQPPIVDIAQRQACAAVGQPHLVRLYNDIFATINGMAVGQVLLTRKVLKNDRRSRNLKRTLFTLMSDNVIPICNENDSVAIAELSGEEIGDNDMLGAMLAQTIDADIYVILTTVDSLYDANPHTSNDAKPINTVYAVRNNLIQKSDDTTTGHSTGGMKSKLKAIKSIRAKQCHAIIANGTTPQPIRRLLNNSELGTLFYFR